MPLATPSRRRPPYYRWFTQLIVYAWVPGILFFAYWMTRSHGSSSSFDELFVGVAGLLAPFMGYALLIVGAIAAFYIVRWWWHRRRRQTIEQVAEQCSARFIRNVDLSYLNRLRKFPCLHKNHVEQRVENMLIQSLPEGTISHFDFVYTEFGAEDSHRVRRSIIHLHSDQVHLPPMMLRSVGFLDRWFESSRMDFDDDPDFATQYIVRSNDEERAREVLSPELRKFIRSIEPTAIDTDGNDIILFRSGYSNDPQRCMQRLVEARALLTRLLRQSKRPSEAKPVASKSVPPPPKQIARKLGTPVAKSSTAAAQTPSEPPVAELVEPARAQVRRGVSKSRGRVQPPPRVVTEPIEAERIDFPRPAPSNDRPVVPPRRVAADVPPPPPIAKVIAPPHASRSAAGPATRDATRPSKVGKPKPIVGLEAGVIASSVVLLLIWTAVAAFSSDWVAAWTSQQFGITWQDRLASVLGGFLCGLPAVPVAMLLHWVTTREEVLREKRNTAWRRDKYHHLREKWSTAGISAVIVAVLLASPLLVGIFVIPLFVCGAVTAVCGLFISEILESVPLFLRCCIITAASVAALLAIYRDRSDYE